MNEKIWRAEPLVEKAYNPKLGAPSSYDVFASPSVGRMGRKKLATIDKSGSKWVVTLEEGALHGYRHPSSCGCQWRAFRNTSGHTFTNDTLKEATAELRRWFMGWQRQHDPHPADVQQYRENCYVGPRDDARKYQEQTRGAMLSFVRSIRELANELERHVPDEKELPKVESAAIGLFHRYVNGQRNINPTSMLVYARSIVEHQHLAEVAKLAIGEDRARELDEEDIARRFAERLGAKR